MDPKNSESQLTLDETVESLTPFVANDPPIVEQVDTPPPVGTPKMDKSLKSKLGALASPFKGKSFHLGPMKKNKLLEPKDDSDKEVKETKRWKKKKPKPEEVTTDEDPGIEGESEGISGTEESHKEKKKRKGSTKSKAGALVKRLGSLGSRRASRSSPEPGVGGDRRSSGSSSLTPSSVRRRTPDGRDGPPSDPSLHDDSGSRYGSVENVDTTRPDMSSSISTTKPQATLDCEHPTIKESAEDTEQYSEDKAKRVNDSADVISESTNTSKSESSLLLAEINVADIASSHPISTLPFSKSTWRRKKDVVQEIPRPIESPSPEDALRKRIAFVAQTSLCFSEDREDWVLEEDEEDLSLPKLTRMVKLAQEKRRTESSFTPTDRSLDPSQETDRTDDEDFQDTEDARLLPKHGMPPFGDLLDESKVKTDMATGSSTHPTTPGTERREHLYKILVIGELGTGKTSIIKRYVHQFFSQHYRATIGVDFALKVLNWDSNTTIRLQLWDIAGQERFGNMTRVYYKEAVGAFIVFDVTRAATFDAVVKWKQDLDSKVQLPDGSPIPCILLANKCDQQKEGIVNTPAKMDEYCKEKGFSGWFETSAKENINIEEAARSLVNKILINDKLLQSGEVKDSERLSLDTGDGVGSNQQGKQCAC